MCIIEMTALALAADESDSNSKHHHSNMTAGTAALANSNEEDYDPIICATDLLDGMVEGLAVSFVGLVRSSPRYGPHFLSVLHTLCQHDVGGVRMSALALLGDLARKAPSLLEPAVPELLAQAVASTDLALQSPSVCTNAVWAVGEICVCCQGHAQLLEPVAGTLIQNLLSLLVDMVMPGLVENAAACLGRLAKVCAGPVAAHLDRLLLGWCDAIGKVSDPTERRDACQGFLCAVYANPQGIQQAATTHGRQVVDVMVAIVSSIATWHFPVEPTVSMDGDDMMMFMVAGAGSITEGSINAAANDSDASATMRPFPPVEAELGQALAKFMQDMKTSVGEETWELVMRHLSVKVRKLIRDVYRFQIDEQTNKQAMQTFRASDSRNVT